MIYYMMNCPVHDSNILKTSKTVKYAGKANTPIFECEICKRYYVYDKERSGSVVATLGGREVFASNVTYKVGNDSFEKPKQVHNSSMGQNSVIRGGGGSYTSFPKYEDPVVRIKHVKDEEIPKAKNNLLNIRNEFPGIITDSMSVYDFMFKVFGNKVNKQVFVRNTSLIWKENLVHKVEFYVVDSAYLNKKLPQDVYISFGGKLSKGEFVVDEIRVLNKPSKTSEWIQQPLAFLYDGSNKSNWFYTITEKPAEPNKKLKGELAAWNEYLNWKRQLAELRIRGIKYIGIKIDIEERKMTFLAVTEGDDQFKEFRKFINRNEVSAFSNKYSKNRWFFEFKREYQDTQDSGIDLMFMEYGDRYEGVEELRDSSWIYADVVSKKHKDDDSKLSLSEKMSIINRNYFNPIFHEIVFELTERATTLVKRDLRRIGSVTDASEKVIFDEFYGDGYLATSQIGDFALLSRLQRAIEDLSNGKSAQQSLNKWLFDIKKANNPDSIEKIEIWQNKAINESQKKAVEKIISTPDVCLIQGPPGTGKTTVIAEAIYQLVERNKRVLIASQANLAVDNALERLITDPKIRAIRLGSAKKIDDSVKNITEEHVLETFYNSIVDYIQVRYINKWKKIDLIKHNVEKDKEKLNRIDQQMSESAQNIEDISFKLADKKNYLDSEENISKKNELRTIKMSISMMLDYCDNKSDGIEVVLDWNRLTNMWNSISEDIRILNENGIYLTRIGIDTDVEGTPSKISQANRIIKHILQNIRKCMDLMGKLNKDSQFGGESEEIESLKLVEAELREKMMEDPSVVSKWQSVNKKIKELSQAGVGLDEDMLSILGENASSQSRDIIKAKLDDNIKTIEHINETILDFSKAELVEIDNSIQESEADDELIEKEIIELEKSIIDITKDIQDYGKEREELLDKYEANDDNFETKVSEYVNNIEDRLKTNLRRSEWEDIFTGLRTWVNDIPDYSQEKDIFLKAFINGCNVVGVSCTENARTLTDNGFDDFDVVIIDEVSKATPPELLIPMLRGRKIVLVGDHRQLPPLFNEHEKSYEEVAKQQEDNGDIAVPLTMEDFEKYKDMVTASLFERYFQSADESIKETLKIQYRMHSDIMELINLFYDGELRDGNEDEYTEDTKAHYLNIYSNFGTEMITPERHAYWFDSSRLAGERVFEYFRDQSHSAENIVEAETIIELLRKMELQYSNMDIKEPVSVGVISFYFNQVSLIRKMIKKESFHSIDVEVNTVDRFQGKEKAIIFVSLVRNVRKPKYSLESYIAAFQRINVAFSRAQNLLVILGSTDMYADQPVRITDMNDGKEKVIYPYKRILEMMNNNGTYFTCDEVISEDRVDEILLNIEKQGVEG